MNAERIKLLFVVGAGASKEFGFPTGEELKKKISHYLRAGDDRRSLGGYRIQDETVREVYRDLSRSDARPGISWLDEEALVRESRRLSSSMALMDSIDSLLFSRRGDEFFSTVGKVGISRAILAAEGDSSLSLKSSNNYDLPKFNEMKGNWLLQLFSILSSAGTRQEFERRLAQVAFITFNYDRIIEAFFAYSVSTVYGSRVRATQEAVKSVSRDLEGILRVKHVYGDVGPFLSGSNDITFGQAQDSHIVREGASRIRTFGEGLVDDNHAESLSELVSSADNIVFLGFGFHKQNIQCLKPLERKRYLRVIATTKGLSEDNLDISKERLGKVGINTGDDRFESKTCAEILSDYRMYLTDCFD